jgi:hypothetical protein
VGAVEWVYVGDEVDGITVVGAAETGVTGGAVGIFEGKLLLGMADTGEFVVGKPLLGLLVMGARVGFMVPGEFVVGTPLGLLVMGARVGFSVPVGGQY